MRLIIKPEAFVVVAVRVPKLAFSIGLVSHPLAFILIAVFEYLDSMAFPLSILIEVPRIQTRSILRQPHLLHVLQALVSDHVLEPYHILISLFVLGLIYYFLLVDLLFVNVWFK